MNKFKFAAILFLALLLLIGCGKQKESNAMVNSNPYKRTEFLMGTVVTIKIYDKDKEAVLDKVFDRIELLASQITVNEDGSIVDEINENAGRNPVQVPEDIYRLVKAGKEYSGYSGGDFDITIGPLTNLWHIGFPDEKKPTQSEINAVLPLINYTKIELNEDKQTVFLPEQGMMLDLGGIAKGFITDEVIKVLNDNKVESAIVDLGGNIYVKGTNPTGKPWEVGVQDPFSDRGEMVGKMEETNTSIVTSGIYERYLEVDGVKYHHILSPKNGYSVNNEVAGITIVSDKSFDGDGYSTTIFIKGIEEGLKAVEKMEGIEAIFVTKDKEVYLTSGLKGKFTLTNEKFKLANE
ncbi:FAD:protein FMN transferase [Niallia circulans]|uniref:FAD:protein FMN transferase n=1 Tax=Niallia TaxID=2837506 RepID=UPI00077C1422|nr:FAD:protein FMN transferase [Niallia circulans]MDR4318951.1 FAD:protein FMN transferase [Niallia circulans]MED3841335.1 FAD:protein FMN transferase [Niallia circulans]MED4245933.1 FAD:protein FMN transferase [Niallia circulans]MED4248819.1 FAD:protein FMN transferase [Niallia circulans]MED5100989.1 FAD:protein FMN transferase [Niallia circulans]